MMVSGWKSEVYGEQDGAHLFGFCLNCIGFLLYLQIFAEIFLLLQEK